MRALDWIARTTMLALAGFATLALIGSLASLSDSALSNAFPGQLAPIPDVVPEPDLKALLQIQERERSGVATPAQPERAIAAPRQTTAFEREVVRWLKALTYAVIALAVFAAAGVVALARVAHHLARR